MLSADLIYLGLGTCKRHNARIGRTWERLRMERPNGAGPGMPGPFRSHLDAGDFDGVAVHGARDGYLVAGMSYNFVLVGNLIDFAVVGHQYGGRSAFNALGCASFVAKHCFFGRAVLIDNRAG